MHIVISVVLRVCLYVYPRAAPGVDGAYECRVYTGTDLSGRPVSQHPTEAVNPATYHIYEMSILSLPSNSFKFPEAVVLRECRLLRATVA